MRAGAEAESEGEVWARYSRQILFAPLGREGQERLRAASAAIIGCGALGGAQAELLTRAGVGRLILVDRDLVEASNLQRQRLFTEADAAEGAPKAAAAARRLAAVNAEVEVVARVADLGPENIEELLAGAQILLDGCDNLETRYLLNDYSQACGAPWIYGAVVGSYGATFTILPAGGLALSGDGSPAGPGPTACLECLFGPQPAELTETCDTRGVLNWAVDWVASQQAGEAVKWMAGAAAALRTTLIARDLWSNEASELRAPPRDPNCRACARRDWVHLRGERRAPVTLCGRDAVQIHERGRELSLSALAARLAPLGEVRRHDLLLRFQPKGDARARELVIFPDGRAIIRGAADAAAARAAYARYIGA